MTLPTKLKAEPLIDAIFECRLTTRENIPLSGVFPGILFSSIKDEEKSLERLPQYDIPEFIRKNEPHMKYLPLIRVQLSDYNILIGDSSISISCILPYRGWDNFKEKIISILTILIENDLIENIERFSIKYVDLIETDSIKEQVDLVNISLSIGNEQLENQPYQIRMDIERNGLMNIIQVISNATYQDSNNNIRNGVIIDIDSIKLINNHSREQIEQLKNSLEKNLDEIHQTSKTIFFSCLKEETINNKLGAEYDQV